MDGASKGILSGSGKRIVEETLLNSKINKVTVKIQSLIDAHVYYTGQVSGELYEWQKAGAIVSVDEQDVPDLLAKKLGKKTCCGGGTNKIFQLAD